MGEGDSGVSGTHIENNDIPMAIINVGARGWTAVDAAEDGAVVGVSVRHGARAGARPQVVKCASSARGAAGAEALADLARVVGVSGFPWTVALKHGSYKMLVIAEPPVLASEMERSLRWTLGAMIDFPIDEASVAWMPIPTAEFQPNRAKHIYAIVSRKAEVNEQATLFQKAKLNLRAVDVRETGQRNIAALLEKKGEGLGLLSVGPTGVTITFTFGGELYLDRFIEQSLEELVASDEAGRQKLFERIALQVLRSVDFISRNFSFMPVGRIVIAPLPGVAGLSDYLTQNLPVTVENLDLASVFDLSLVPELQARDSQWRYFIALGAALRGMGKRP